MQLTHHACNIAIRPFIAWVGKSLFDLNVSQIMWIIYVMNPYSENLIWRSRINKSFRLIDVFEVFWWSIALPLRFQHNRYSNMRNLFKIRSNPKVGRSTRMHSSCSKFSQRYLVLFNSFVDFLTFLLETFLDITFQPIRHVRMTLLVDVFLQFWRHNNVILTSLDGYKLLNILYTDHPDICRHISLVSIALRC